MEEKSKKQIKLRMKTLLAYIDDFVTVKLRVFRLLLRTIYLF